VALLESICFAGAVFVIFSSISSLSGQIYSYIIAAVIFVSVLLLNVRYYQHSLNAHHEMAVIEEEAKEIGV
jgi:hypothetical protein